MTGNWPEDVSKEGVKALVQRALELDDTYGEAHAMLGLLVWKEDPQRAQAEFDRAVLGSPGSAFIYEAQGYFLGQIRDFRGALRVYEKGIRLNPLSAGLLANAGSVAHPYDTEAALAYYRQAMLSQRMFEPTTGLAQPTGLFWVNWTRLCSGCAGDTRLIQNTSTR
jgi:tetratricopeptide (TPR) repeat protein